MAPIPALYVAASLADQNALAVGDFKQLPPIVQSGHDLSVRWLGRDVFEVAGITKAYRSRITSAAFPRTRRTIPNARKYKRDRQ